MCGLAGILDPRGVERDEPRRMAEVVAHRGPDDAAVHTEPGIGFGFRRLAIIDLEGGQQPIASEDGDVRVVCNGEIYNYRAIRRRLESLDHRFSTDTDTEVLVHLYEEKGQDLLGDLRGMFAFALWDRDDRKLLLARDHLGQKPLYWARHGQRFWFASEIKSILAVAPRFREMDPEALHEYLTLRVVSGQRSMFRGIRQLPAGHSLEITPGGSPSIRRYWSLSYEPKQRLGDEEALDRLEDQVREAVRLHLVSDVEVGAFLSGGIDSGVLTAVMSQISGPGVQTFSMGTPYRSFDERPAARTVARRYDTRHREAPVGADAIRLLPRTIAHLDEPSDPLSVCMYRLSEMTARHVKVAIGGDGGDEMFGGYDRYAGVPYVKYWAALPEGFRRWLADRITSWAPDEAWYKSIGNQLQWLEALTRVDPERRFARSLNYFYFTPGYRDRVYTERYRERVDGFDPERAVAHWQRSENVERALDGMLLADSMVRLPNHSVMIADRMTMAHGLEARSPFMDHRLAEFVATLPVRMKVKGRRRRVVQKALARRLLPAEIVDRPKQGFSSAIPYMMDAHFETLFRHYLPQSRLVDAGVLDPTGIEDLLGGHLGGGADHGKRLWLLLNAELWYRIRLEGQSADAMEAEIGELVDTARRPVAGAEGPAPVRDVST